jgi:hypothetical protein
MTTSWLLIFWKMYSKRREACHDWIEYIGFKTTQFEIVINPKLSITKLVILECHVLGLKGLNLKLKPACTLTVGFILFS